MTTLSQKPTASTFANSLPDAVNIPEPVLQPTISPQTSQTLSLPLDGFSRASQLMPFLPIGESTLWKWAKTGQFPAPVKLSPTVTAWRNKDVHDWFNQCNEQASIAANSPANDNNSNEVA